jgi:uncharacterized RDD family membrane protein YckC
MWGMGFREAVLGKRVFDPHETARAQALEGAPLASFWRRSVAFSVDFLIVLVVFVGVEIARRYFSLKYLHRDIQMKTGFDPHELEDLAILVVYSGLSVWWTNGLTLGKRPLRIRVVSLKKPKITFWQAIERALGYGASSLEGGFGFVQYFIHHNRQCVHDRIAETIVVNESPAAKASKQ